MLPNLFSVLVLVDLDGPSRRVVVHLGQQFQDEEVQLLIATLGTVHQEIGDQLFSVLLLECLLVAGIDHLADQMAHCVLVDEELGGDEWKRRGLQ